MGNLCYNFHDMEDNSALMYAIEVHSAEGLQKYFDAGGNPNEVHNGVPLFTTMVEMYLRSPKFKDCVKVFIHHGLHFEDQTLLAVLSDDAGKLQQELDADATLVHKTYSAFNNTFTSLEGATLLHYCAEYNHPECAKVLLKYGADVNAATALDECGFGGHTPIFHAVAQHNNNSADVLQLLLAHAADVLFTVKGLIWGKGYEWETFIPTVNPISYAMMGLLPQTHRNPVQIAETISLLLLQAYGIDYQLPNVPNAYLK